MRVFAILLLLYLSCTTVLCQEREESVDPHAAESEEALARSRKTLEAEENGPNLYRLLLALVETETEAEPSAAVLEEAREVARKLADVPDARPEMLLLACTTALMADDLELLRGCSRRLEKDAPDLADTHFMSWRVAVAEGRYEAAAEAIERARSAGLSTAQLNAMVEATDAARPLFWNELRSAKRILLCWMAGLILLLIAGLALSRFALRTAGRPPSVHTGESVGFDALLRGLYRVVLWLSGFYYILSIPLVVLAVLILGVLFVSALADFEAVPVKLILVVCLLVFATAWAGFKSLLGILRQPEEAPPGEKLELSNHEGLRKVLGEVASVIGTRPVDRVYLTPATEMAVTERGGLMRQLRGATERCLILGVGVFDGFRIDAFKAMLAHEYGHFCNKDTAGGSFVIRVRWALGEMARSLAAAGAATWYNPAWLFLWGFTLVFGVISQGASKLQEVLADRWAAFAYGPGNFEEGLRHVVEASIRFSAHSGSTLREVVEGREPLVNLYHYRPRAEPPENQMQMAIREAMSAKPSLYDSHPSPNDRIEWVRALGVERGAETAETGGSKRDVWELFPDRKALEEAMTSVVRGLVARESGVILLGNVGPGGGDGASEGASS